jgi:DNA-binding response OmpR family regulator
MRILLIEDEKKVADFIERGLKAERYAVDVCLDGQSGWDAAESFNYDLIVLDLMLPRLSGTEVLENSENPPEKPAGAGPDPHCARCRGRQDKKFRSGGR